MAGKDDNGLPGLRNATDELRRAIDLVRDQRGVWQSPAQVSLPSAADTWNFKSFEIYINQRFSDLSLQLRERYEAQQTGVTAALAAAEKAVNAALIAAEKAVDKAEGAQQLRNEAQNEFRKSLSDLSGLMLTTKEGTTMIESLRREVTAAHEMLVGRVTMIERASSNIQGRIWAVSALFAICALLVQLFSRFIH